MRIHELFDINLKEKGLLSFIGAGGKTTTIFKLAQELKKLDKKVLITTSTAIFYPNRNDYDRIIIDDSVNLIEALDDVKSGTITIIGREVSKENKLLGLSKEIIEKIHVRNIFDFILVEADGAKRKSIKAPADHEPVIPENTDKTIGVIGIDSIEKKINEENVHRPKLFCEITNSKIEEMIDEEKIYRLIENDKGLFKGTPIKSEKYILLNKVDNKDRQKRVLRIIELIIENEFEINGIIAANIVNEEIFCFFKT